MDLGADVDRASRVEGLHDVLVVREWGLPILDTAAGPHHVARPHVDHQRVRLEVDPWAHEQVWQHKPLQCVPVGVEFALPHASIAHETSVTALTKPALSTHYNDKGTQARTPSIPRT